MSAPTAAQQAEERIRRWEARGGVRLDPDDPNRHAIAAGVAETGERFRFRCDVCGKVETCDQEMGPCCTGPGWTDDHELTPMRRIP